MAPDPHEPPKRQPYDNAACESFMKPLKYEEVYRSDTANWPRPMHRAASSGTRSQQTALHSARAMSRCRVEEERREYPMTLLERISSGGAPPCPDLSHSQPRMTERGADRSTYASLRPLSRRSELRPRVTYPQRSGLSGWITANPVVAND